MNANDAIEQLGGTAEAARFFNVSQPAISNWRKRGLPAWAQLELIKRGDTAPKTSTEQAA